MLGGVFLIIAGILIVIYPPLLSIIVAMLLIAIGSIIVAIGYHNRKLRRHYDNPVIELFFGSRVEYASHTEIHRATPDHQRFACRVRAWKSSVYSAPS